MFCKRKRQEWQNVQLSSLLWSDDFVKPPCAEFARGVYPTHQALALPCVQYVLPPLVEGNLLEADRLSLTAASALGQRQ